MNACFFTFGPDALALVESVVAFRQAGGKNVAIFDDAENPIPEAVINHIAPEMREQTTFKRRNNLLGWPCLLGQLDCMEKAAATFGVNSILKIDSDTIVLNLGWVHPKAPLCGFHITGNPYIFGMCYILSVPAIQRIRHAIEQGHKIADAKVEEDTVITTEALALYGPSVRRINWSEGMAGGWDYTGKTPIEKYLKCAVVTFGNRRQISNCSCHNERRERVALEMARFRKRLDVS